MINSRSFAVAQDDNLGLHVILNEMKDLLLSLPKTNSGSFAVTQDDSLDLSS